MPEHPTPPALAPAALVRLSVVFYLLMAGLGIALMSWRNPGSVAYEALGDGTTRTLDAAAGIIAGLAIVGGTHFVRNLAAMKRQARALAAILGQPSTGAIAVLAVVSSVGEELLFRGALQPTLGFVPTLILFAVLHIGSRKTWAVSMGFAAIGGLVLGGLTLWTGNLAAALLCHMLVNYFNLLAIVQPVAKESSR